MSLDNRVDLLAVIRAFAGATGVEKDFFRRGGLFFSIGASAFGITSGAMDFGVAAAIRFDRVRVKVKPSSSSS